MLNMMEVASGKLGYFKEDQRSSGIKTFRLGPPGDQNSMVQLQPALTLQLNNKFSCDRQVASYNGNSYR